MFYKFKLVYNVVRRSRYNTENLSCVKINIWHVSVLTRNGHSPYFHIRVSPPLWIKRQSSGSRSPWKFPTCVTLTNPQMIPGIRFWKKKKKTKNKIYNRPCFIPGIAHSNKSTVQYSNVFNNFPTYLEHRDSWSAHHQAGSIKYIIFYYSCPYYMMPFDSVFGSLKWSINGTNGSCQHLRVS